MDRLWQAQGRCQGMAWFAAYWLSAESVLRLPQLRRLAYGWKFLSLIGLAQLYKLPLNYMAGQHYAPLTGAFLRKHGHLAEEKAFDIRDRKREFY